MKHAVFVASLLFFFLTTSVSANQSTSDPSETDFLAIKSSVDTVNRGGTGNSAKGLIKRFIKKYPNSPYLDDVYLLRSVFAFHRNDPKDAKKWLTKIEKDFPQSEHTKNAQAHLTAIDNLTVSLKKSDASWYDKKKAYKNVGRSLSDHYTATITPAQTPKEPIRVATHNTSISKTQVDNKKMEVIDKATTGRISNPIKNAQIAQSSTKNSSKFMSGLGQSNQIKRKETPSLKSTTKTSSNGSQKSHLTTQEKQQLIDSCQKESCYDEAKIAYRNNDLELSRDLYKKFLKENPNHRYTDWAKKSLRTIRKKLPPQQRIVRDSWGLVQGSPEQDAFHKKHKLGKYQKNYFKLDIGTRSWEAISKEIEMLSELRINTKNNFEKKLLSKEQENEIVSQQFLIQADEIGSAIAANISQTPENLEKFNDTLISFNETKSKFSREIRNWRTSKIGENSREVSLDLIDSMNRNISPKGSEYLRNYINVHIDIEDTIRKINDLAWNPIAPQELVLNLLPILEKDINSPHLNKRIRDAVSNARKNQQQEFNSLPDSSAPKIYARKTIEIIHNKKSVVQALEHLKKEKSYYLKWRYRDWPTSVSQALETKAVDAVAIISQMNSVHEASKYLESMTVWKYDNWPIQVRELFENRVITTVNNRDSIVSAVEFLQQIPHWEYGKWPQSITEALKVSNQRRRTMYAQREPFDFGTLQPDKKDIVYMGGLVLGKSSFDQAINGYLSHVESSLTQESSDLDAVDLVFSTLARSSTRNPKKKNKNFMGIFEDPFKINIGITELNKNHKSVCIIYKSMQDQWSLAKDCLFFKDLVLSGFSLDRSSSQCPSKCEYHNIDIGYFSKMGFKLTDESVDGIRLWRKHEKSNTKFNYRLWGGVSQYIKDPKKGLNGIYATQKANVCVFDKEIESILRENEKEGAWTCS